MRIGDGMLRVEFRPAGERRPDDVQQAPGILKFVEDRDRFAYLAKIEREHESLEPARLTVIDWLAGLQLLQRTTETLHVERFTFRRVGNRRGYGRLCW